MNSIDEAGHVQRVFEIYGYDEARKLNLVADLRDVAIKRLKPVMANVPRGMPERIKAAYQAKGISIEWDLPADALEFCLQAQKAGLSESQRSACALLCFCTEALDKEAVPPSLQQHMVKAFAGLDADYIAAGKQPPASRLAKSRHAETDAMKAYAREHWHAQIDPSLSAPNAANILKKEVCLSHKTLKELVQSWKRELRGRQ